MTNVTNSKTINPNFLEEAGDYLVAAGYTRSVGQCGSIYFEKDQKVLVIKNENADFMIYRNSELGRSKAGYKRYMAITGIGNLDLLKWMFLLDVADIIPLKHVAKEARRSAPADGFTVQVFEHFKVTDDHNAVPVNY